MQHANRMLRLQCPYQTFVEYMNFVKPKQSTETGDDWTQLYIVMWAATADTKVKNLFWKFR